MAIETQAAAVGPGVGDRAENLILASPKHGCGYRGRRQPDEKHMIQTDAIKAIFQRQDSLDFVRLDHRRENVSNCKTTVKPSRPADEVRQSQNASEIVGRMSPLGRQPGIVEV